MDEPVLGLIKSCLLAFHLLGLVLGLGAATMLDLIILRFVGARVITDEYWTVISLLSKAVTGGLILLWLSGIGFLVHYGFANPDLLANPKIWAKLVIVFALTLNGVFVHRVILPLIQQRVGRPMFEGLTVFQRSCLLASGAISGISWWIPLLLGAFPQLNFTVAAQTILLSYGILLTLAVVSSSLIVRYILPQLTTVTVPLAEYNLLRTLARKASTINAIPIHYGEAIPKPVRVGARSRLMFPAAVSALGFVLLAGYALNAPVPSLRIDNDNHAGDSVERPNASFVVRPAAAASNSTDAPAVAQQPEQGPAVAPKAAASPVVPELPAAETTGHPGVESGEEPVTRQPAPQKAAFVGIWGADASSCSAKSSVNGYPFAMISEDGATAGDTYCAFDKIKADSSSWHVLARCFNGQERWTSRVRLAVREDRLTWQSQRGMRTYHRCERTMAAASPAARF